ncbi:MAG: alpha/beta hydrolase [Eubacteriales bacterium]|nr:alpha/beta hydrolase [Eubacteriales bacterium]
MYTKTVITRNTLSYEKKITLYKADTYTIKGAILYFHGGGLLYGNREDLPPEHIRLLTESGYAILAYDYPLAPAAKIDLILDDVLSSIRDYIKNAPEYIGSNLPYFLWGRSSGAFISLLAASKLPSVFSEDDFDGTSSHVLPRGVLSYYGYGLLTDGWIDTPSDYYLSFPALTSSVMDHLPEGLHCTGELETHYSAYIYARQTGSWKSLFYEGREKYLYLSYSLRLVDALPCPLFCTHSTGDTDVPFSEFQELCRKYNADHFIASGKTHDFDRDTDSTQTKQLLKKTLSFLNREVLHTK